jgi:DNA (cytosine-5)-methyltransferase 1
MEGRGRSSVVEQWSVEGDSLLRTVTVGSIRGTSEIPLAGPRDGSFDSNHGMRDYWDSAVLKGAVPKSRAPAVNGEVLRIADFFCGCGGLSLGVRQAAQALGLLSRFLAAVDSNRNALEVFQRNLEPDAALALNLWEVTDFQIAGRGNGARFVGEPELLNPLLASLQGRVDVLLGGPPCQGYSNSNNHTRRDDPRNVLYLVMPAAAVALKAPALLIENVPEIIHDRKQPVATARRLLADAGYSVTEEVVNALDVGVPQRRKRHFLIAVKGMAPNLNELVESLKPRPRSIDWAIHDLVDCEGETAFDEPAALSDENRKRIQYLFEHDLHEMPDWLRPPSHRSGHTYPSVYGRLRWNEPAGTITTGFMSPGRGRYIHPLRPRTLTAHEAARLQCFPDSFQFRLADGAVPPKTWLGDMIGEAVPPPMGYVAGICAIAGSMAVRQTFSSQET